MIDFVDVYEDSLIFNDLKDFNQQHPYFPKLYFEKKFLNFIKSKTKLLSLLKKQVT